MQILCKRQTGTDTEYMTEWSNEINPLIRQYFGLNKSTVFNLLGHINSLGGCYNTVMIIIIYRVAAVLGNYKFGLWESKHHSSCKLFKTLCD